MSQVSESVGTSSTGSTNAVDTSGSSSMSLSLIAWKPRMDEPSKPSPSRIMSSSSVAAGIEKCCQVPGRSQNFTSTTWMFFCRMRSSSLPTSLVWVIAVLGTGAGGRGHGGLALGGEGWWSAQMGRPCVAGAPQGRRGHGHGTPIGPAARDRAGWGFGWMRMRISGTGLGHCDAGEYMVRFTSVKEIVQNVQKCRHDTADHTSIA